MNRIKDIYLISWRFISARTKTQHLSKTNLFKIENQPPQMNQQRCVVLLVVLIAVSAIAEPFSTNSVLTIYNPKVPRSGLCSSEGSLIEMDRDARPIQTIQLPNDCLFYTNIYSGYITLSRDRMSAVMPCCFDQTATPGKIGFVEIFSDGTTSSTTTLQLSSNATNIHNIVKDGNNIWFSGREPSAQVFATAYYADLTTNEVIALVEDDTFFIDIINGDLLVSNWMGLHDGLMQIGSGLPTTAGQSLSPMLYQNNALDWFVCTDKYAYYAQFAPELALVRCDPNTWEPLYSIALPGEMLHFVVLYDSDTHITIAGNVLINLKNGTGEAVVQVYVDNGFRIVEETRLYGDQNGYYKVGSLAPSTCVNEVLDDGESDIDCGRFCRSCSVGEKCNFDFECASYQCSASGICLERPPNPFTPGNLLLMKNPKPTATGVWEDCSSQGFLWEVTPEASLVQQIQLPVECQFYTDAFVGYATLSRDRLSAIVPCCINQDDAPQTAGFVEIYFNGTISPMRTIQLPSATYTTPNMVKDGNDIWFNVRGSGFAQTLYADLSMDPAIANPLADNDAYFADIINDTLLVSNWYNMNSGLMQVGSDLPKTSNQVLTPVITQQNSINWFTRTDKYAYYAQSTPENALVRCDPNTWEPLYSLALDAELVGFAVVSNSDNNITIVGNAYIGTEGFGQPFLQVFHDDGASLSLVSNTNLRTQTYFKVVSLAPSHCLNDVQDYDESDLNCGGRSCGGCDVGRTCETDWDCASGYCKSGVCAALPPVVPLTPGNMIVMENLLNQMSRCSSKGVLLEVTPDLEVVQRIFLPAECQLNLNFAHGYPTLSRDKQSVVVPCCIDQAKFPQTIGFVELHANGSISPMRTLYVPLTPVQEFYVLNMVKDGNNLWFTGENEADYIGDIFYADLTSGQLTLLAQEYGFLYADIIGYQLIVSDAFSGPTQIGSGLPTTANQTFAPVYEGVTASWFVHTDDYCYYSQNNALTRCDVNTWAPLYSVPLDNNELIHFVAFYDNSTNVTTIVGHFYGDAETSQLIVFSDDGVRITGPDFLPRNDVSFFKVASPTPYPFVVVNPPYQAPPITSSTPVSSDTPLSTNPDGPTSSAPLSTNPDSPTSSAPLQIPVTNSQTPRAQVSAGTSTVNVMFGIAWILLAL